MIHSKTAQQGYDFAQRENGSLAEMANAEPYPEKSEAEWFRGYKRFWEELERAP